MGLPVVNTYTCDVEKRVMSRQYASQLIEHRALLIEYRALLTECGARLTPHRATYSEYVPV